MEHTHFPRNVIELISEKATVAKFVKQTTPHPKNNEKVDYNIVCEHIVKYVESVKAQMSKREVLSVR